MPQQTSLFETESAVSSVKRIHNTHHDRTGKFTTKEQAGKEQVQRQLEGKQKHIDYLTNMVYFSGIHNRQLEEENKMLKAKLKSKNL